LWIKLRSPSVNVFFTAKKHQKKPFTEPPVLKRSADAAWIAWWWMVRGRARAEWKAEFSPMPT
jgi:hypothetical protein